MLQSWNKDREEKDVPGDPVVKTELPMQESWVRSLIREPRSHMPQGTAKQTNKKD